MILKKYQELSSQKFRWSLKKSFSGSVHETTADRCDEEGTQTFLHLLQLKRAARVGTANRESGGYGSR